MSDGDVLYYNTWGGGGWGDPLQRDAELVALDCRRGLVTKEGALRYGVVLGANGALDSEATQRLRTRIEAERPPIEMFDRGGTVEELRARCKAETHLEPPKPPVFAKWMKKSGVFA